MDSSTDLISPESFIQNDKEREDPVHQEPLKRIREPAEHMPKLYYVFPPPAENLRQDLRKQALLLQQQLISEDQLDSDELEQLWHLLEQHVSETTLKNQRLINHSDYLRLQEVLTEKGRKFLTAQAFAQLLSDSTYLDLVEIDAIYEYTVQQMRIMQHRIEFTLYDEVGQGYLRGFDLENYLIDLMPKLEQLQDHMLPSFQKFYICSVVKRFFFFLDPLRTGRISIPEMVSSRMYAELLELREKSESSPELQQQQNPFSLPAVRTIYENYLSLDLDRNGLLSREELAAYGSGTLSSAFLDRVLEESHTYYDEMDYKSFQDFVYALENRQVSFFFYNKLDLDISVCMNT